MSQKMKKVSKSKGLRTKKKSKDFMETVHGNTGMIGAYERTEKCISKHQLVEDLARARMECDLYEVTLSNLRREIKSASDDGFFKFEKEYEEDDSRLYPTLFKVLEDFNFSNTDNARVFELWNKKEVYWSYWRDDGIKIPPMKSWDERTVRKRKAPKRKKK